MNNYTLLYSALLPHGFKRRGNALFRVLGDGVLQVVKYEHDRIGNPDLSVGLFSLYSELLPQWFTSRGCIPRYSVANILGFRDLVSILRKKSGNNIDELTEDNCIEQLIDILHTHAVSWLNNITTQKDLIDRIVFLETSWCGEVLWVDDLKIAPFLMCGEFEAASFVVRSILEQHNDAYQQNRTLFSEEEYEKYLEPRKKNDEKLEYLLRIIESRDERKLNEYLNYNYSVNKPLSRFCSCSPYE